ncbi:MAG TPA: HAD family phosphatase [Kineosporiaceae bacterium]|nr:HAD family phosphatase [Kineosporiaceae bacterium]
MSAPPGGPGPAPRLSGLVMDWGGVLTGSLDAAMSTWAGRDGVDLEAFRDVMRQWVGRREPQDPAGDPADVSPGADELEQAPDTGPAGLSPVHRLERGEIEAADFEKELAAELAERGHPVPPEGLLTRMLAGLADLDPRMVDLVRRAKATGIRTALLSNSWGNSYPEQLWQGLFDAVVISGEVGMRKPEPRIFQHTVNRLGLPPQACVMVDDLPHNVTGAVGAGLVGILHRGYDETVAELEVLFDRALH